MDLKFLALELWGLIGILLYVGLVISLILWKIKYFLPASLFKTAHASVGVGLWGDYKLSHAPETIKQGPDIPYFPMAVGAIIFGLAVLSIFINKFSERSPNLPVRCRWLWLIGGVFVSGIGMFPAMAALYSPILFGYAGTPQPRLACYFWLPFVALASLIFYRVSRMNAERYPNLMRYVVFFIACQMLMGTMSLSLIMREAMLVNRISYVYWGATVTLGLIPPSLVILGIAKDFIPLASSGQSSADPETVKGIDE
jgi:hypothetical protein